METIKLLEENLEGELLDTGLGNDFFVCLFDTKENATKAKISKWNDIKLKSFHTAKEIIKKTKNKKSQIKIKSQPMRWEKIFANHISDKRLMSKTYEELKEFNNDDSSSSSSSNKTSRQLSLGTGEQTLRMWRKRDPLCTIDGNVSLCSHYEKQCRGFSKNLKIELPYDLAIPFLGVYIQKKRNSKEISVLLPCSLKHYPQQQRQGKNLSVYQRRNG